MAVDFIASLTLENLQESFQEAGYRVETLTDRVAHSQYLRSATSGVGFDICPGSPMPGQSKSFVDVTLVAVFQIAGDMPPDLLNRWNTSHRFGRLQFNAPFLVFCLDISVMNGVTPAHLRAQIELWDRLVQDLVPFLRTAFAEATAPKPAIRATGDQSPAAAA